MAEIKYIPVSKLWGHPDNPRKDLGDVTELAESIKVNGVLQNLTVVPLIGEITKKWDGESYRVIIGHRRLAAAKLAGLEELPCVVVEMSEREQLSTMLTENMQRSDLTVYEQAQGFQMMLDMGDTVEDIAEKSGFSVTTVRRRVKLLELDKDKFKKSEERGVSLFEYMELEKLKSPERKNEMLDYIGTENFKYKLKQAMRGMHPWSCASIPGRGGKRIHKKIRGALRNDPKGTKYAAELDVAQYYPSISGKRLIWALARKIKDKRFLRTVYSIIESCGGGLAIGYYICQWLANFYLESLDQYIMTLPGVKYMTRYMDNITLLGPNKKQLHKARKLIAAFMQQRLGLSMKANWQIYPTAKRMVSAVGYRFSRTHVILRKRNFLRFTRQCRRVKKRLDAGKPIMFAQASGLLSRAGQLKHCNSHTIRVKYIDPIGVKHLKEVVRNESKRRQRAQQRFLAGGAA